MNKTQGEAQQFDYTFFLTEVKSMCSLLDMARLKDIVHGLGEQAVRQHTELLAATDELNKLRDAVRRFKELEKETQEKQESLIIAMTLLLHVPLKVNPEADTYTDKLMIGDLQNDMYFSVPVEKLDFSGIPLWKSIREILKQTSAIRVFELEGHLASLGVKASRSAIESALAKHKKDFKIERINREAFVSLK